MKIARIILSGLLFFGLSYTFLFLIDNGALNLPDRVKYIQNDLNLQYSSIFSLIGLIAIALYRDLTNRGLIILILTLPLLFLLDGLMIRFVSTAYNIDAISELNLNFKMVYYYSLAPFILIISSLGLKAIGLKSVITKIPEIKVDAKHSTLRLLAFITDIIIITVISRLFFLLRIILFIPVEIHLVGLFYMVTLEVSTGQTIGKRLFGLGVVQNNSSDIDLKRSLIRNIMRIIPLFWIPILTGKIGIHDRISNTQVLNKIEIK